MGSGGFSDVYVGQRKDGSKCALKIMQTPLKSKDDKVRSWSGLTLLGAVVRCLADAVFVNVLTVCET